MENIIEKNIKNLSALVAKSYSTLPVAQNKFSASSASNSSLNPPVAQNKFSVLSASNSCSNPPVAQSNLLNRLNLPATIAQNNLPNLSDPHPPTKNTSSNPPAAQDKIITLSSPHPATKNTSSTPPAAQDKIIILSNPHPATKNTSSTPLAIIEKFSDKELYEYCRFTGINAREWSKRFVAALPEVSRRSLYLKRGHHTIYEFAAKLGGITNTVVNDVLRLEENLRDKPILKSLIGEIGVNKIRVVASIATKETDAFWAQKVEQLSKSALEVLVREVRNVIAQERLNKIEMCQKNPGIFLTEDGKEVLFEEETNADQEGLFEGETRLGQDRFLEGATHVDQVSLFEGEMRLGHDRFLEGTAGADQVSLLEGATSADHKALFDTSETSGGSNHVYVFNRAKPISQTNQTALFGQTYTVSQTTLQKPERINFSVPITPDTEFKLRKFKQQLEKKLKQPANWNRTLKELLKMAGEIKF